MTDRAGLGLCSKTDDLANFHLKIRTKTSELWYENPFLKSWLMSGFLNNILQEYIFHNTSLKKILQKFIFKKKKKINFRKEKISTLKSN